MGGEGPWRGWKREADGPVMMARVGFKFACV